MNIEEIKKELCDIVPEFAKEVEPIYQLLEWEWRDGVPTKKDIQDSLLQK